MYEDKPIRVNTFRDHLNFVTSFLMSVGSAAAFVYFNFLSLPVALTSLSLTLAVVGGVKALHPLIQKVSATKSFVGKIASRFIGKHTIPASRSNLDMYSGNDKLLELTVALSKKMGLKRTPRLRIVDPTQDDEKLGKMATMKYLCNAMVYPKGEGNFECALSPALLEQLSDEQEVAVVAHEIGHAAAGHNVKQMIISLAPTAVQFGAMYDFGSKAITQGSTYASIAAGFGLSVAFCIASRDLVTKERKSQVVFGLVHGAMLAVPTMMGHPEIAQAWLFMYGAAYVNSFISAGYSRTTEYHADRLAAQATGAPRALADGLKRIHIFNKNETELLIDIGFGKRKNSTAPKAIQHLMSTHPTTAARIVMLRRYADLTS